MVNIYSAFFDEVHQHLAVTNKICAAQSHTQFDEAQRQPTIISEACHGRTGASIPREANHAVVVLDVVGNQPGRNICSERTRVPGDSG